MNVPFYERGIGKQCSSAASDQGLHCLHLIQIFLKKMIIMKTNQATPIKDKQLR